MSHYQEINKQLGNLAQVVALGGGQLRPLLQKMETLEASRLPLEHKQHEREEAVEVSRRNRPNADRICREWSRVTELWDRATEEEREELMQAMVIRVEMDEKEEGTCEVALMPQVPCLAPDRLGLTSRMGAGRLVVVNYPPIQFPDFEVTRLTCNNSTTVLSS